MAEHYSVSDTPGLNFETRSCLRMWYAVMQTAVIDIVSSSTKTRREAIDWIESKEKHAGSFEWICSVMGIDPDKVRTAFRKKAAEFEVVLAERLLSRRLAQQVRRSRT